MNQEFVKLLAERSDEVEKLLIGIKQVRDEARKKVQRPGTLIDLNEHQNVPQLPWQPNPNHSLRHFLQHRVPIDEELTLSSSQQYRRVDGRFSFFTGFSEGHGIVWN